MSKTEPLPLWEPYELKKGAFSPHLYNKYALNYSTVCFELYLFKNWVRHPLNIKSNQYFPLSCFTRKTAYFQKKFLPIHSNKTSPNQSNPQSSPFLGSLVFTPPEAQQLSIVSRAFDILHESYEKEVSDHKSSLDLIIDEDEGALDSIKNSLSEIFFRLQEMTEFNKNNSGNSSHAHINIDPLASKKFFQPLLDDLKKAPIESRQITFHRYLSEFKENPFSLDKRRDYKTLACLMSLYGNIKSLEYLKTLFPLKIYLNTQERPMPLLLSCLNEELFKLEIYHSKGIDFSIALLKREILTPNLCPEEKEKFEQALQWLKSLSIDRKKRESP